MNAYYSHPTAVIDNDCQIGEGSKIWHFSHIMPGCTIGNNCNLGQNVVVSPGVVLGNNVLRDLLNDKVITRGEIVKGTNAPLLGEVGHSENEKVLLFPA